MPSRDRLQVRQHTIVLVRVFLLSVGAKAILGIGYGLYRLYKRWPAPVDLLDAAERGDIEAVRAFLKAGADVNAANSGGWTPLYWAALNGHEAVVRMLLDADANVNAASSAGGWTALHLATGNSHEAIVRQLLEAGADVNAADSDRETLLYWAVLYDHEAVVRILLDAGSDVHAAARNVWTRLYWEARRGNKAIAQVLAARGVMPLTQPQCERIISEQFYYLSPERQQQHRTRLEQLQVMTKRVSLERKCAIKSTLDGVEIKSERLPMDLQRLSIRMYVRGGGMRGDSILLAKRKNTGHIDGHWSLVTGHVAEGELCHDAMIREAYEEVGLHLKPHKLQLVGAMHHNSPPFDYIHYAFTADLHSHEPQKREPHKYSMISIASRSQWYPML